MRCIILTCLALVSGILLPCAYAPMHWWPAAPLSLIGLLGVWQHASSAKQSCFYGWVYGLGYYGLGVSWVYISIHVYGNTHAILAGCITALFVMFLACFSACQGWLLKTHFTYMSTPCLLVGFPCSWVILEWLRSHLFTGFPWLLLGYSQIDTPLQAFAPIISVYGISFLFAISIALVVYSGRPTTTEYKKILALLAVVSLWLIGQSLKNYPWTTPDGKQHTVSLIQGNINPQDKFLLQDPMLTIWTLYGNLSLQHLDSDIIIWPENSLPVPLPFSQPFIDELNALATEHKTTFIIGLPTQIPAQPRHYYNSLLALDGSKQLLYHKQHLVPFGEYLPLEFWLRGLINLFDIPMSNFKPGPQTTSFRLANSHLLPLICYEIAYPNAVRQQLNNMQASALVTVSEDGWFGNSWGPHQHLDIARMRALETGRFVLRATSSGISAVIAPNGTILQQSPQFQPFVLTTTFTNHLGTTPWMLLGEMPLLIIMLLGYLLSIRKKSFLCYLKKIGITH